MGKGSRLLLLSLLFFFYKSSPFLEMAPSVPPAESLPSWPVPGSPTVCPE